MGWFVIVFMISFWNAIFWVRWWSFCSQCLNQPPIGKSWKTQHIVGFKYPHHYILWYYQGQNKYVFDLIFLCCDVNIMPYQATQHTATQEGSKVREDIPGNCILKISIVVLFTIIGFSLKKQFFPGEMSLEKALTMLIWNFWVTLCTLKKEYCYCHTDKSDSFSVTVNICRLMFTCLGFIYPDTHFISG